MRVRDLVKDTVWRPSRDYDSARPSVSVLLPTFRRGHDQSFVKAANSILDQSLRDLELIVIDDGSTDGTARQIAMLMAADDRVSCLTHPHNVGLPAISEYEGFARARGQYIAFGFDDFIFDRGALSSLMAFPLTSPQSVVHGYVGWFDAHGTQHFYGKDAVPQETLKFFNFLANASFLIPRAILEDVGLFDPHIAAARMCDWDLWCRILKKYPIHRAPVFVGTEYGNTRVDSLGNTYPLIEEAFQEYFAADRNASLKLGAFPELDVWKMPENCSALLSTHILWSREFFRSRSWASRPEFPAATDEAIPPWTGRPAVGLYGALGKPMALFFDALPSSLRQNLRYIHPGLTDAQLARYLAGCAAVIAIDPTNPQSERVRSTCAAMSIPLYRLIGDGVRTADTQINQVTLVADDAARNLKVLTEIIANSRPVNAITWIMRLRTLLDRGYARAECLEADLRDRSIRLAAAQAELSSRSYRLALRVRGLANGLRALAKWLRLR